MYFGDHNPPHFHIVTRDGREALVALGTLEVLEGAVGSAILHSARAWARDNAAPLEEAWARMHETN